MVFIEIRNLNGMERTGWDRCHPPWLQNGQAHVIFIPAQPFHFLNGNMTVGGGVCDRCASGGLGVIINKKVLFSLCI